MSYVFWLKKSHKNLLDTGSIPHLKNKMPPVQYFVKYLYYGDLWFLKSVTSRMPCGKKKKSTTKKRPCHFCFFLQKMVFWTTKLHLPLCNSENGAAPTNKKWGKNLPTAEFSHFLITNLFASNYFITGWNLFSQDIRLLSNAQKSKNLLRRLI